MKREDDNESSAETKKQLKLQKKMKQQDRRNKEKDNIDPESCVDKCWPNMDRNTDRRRSDVTICKGRPTRYACKGYLISRHLFVFGAAS